MKIFLTGGFVRDTLLGLEPHDRDYVVVGSSESEMTSLGFKRVGDEVLGFPVFLHPETNDEYALARKERKVGVGYGGFEVDISDVTLEEDLSRRDISINSMAMDDQGNIFDPFNGKSDLENKVLRHTSDAFSEDPLRVVRLARFLARYYSLGFTVHPDTEALCREVVKSGELDALPPERFWLEIMKNYDSKNPELFFDFLHCVGALNNTKFFKNLFGGNISSDDGHDMLKIWHSTIAIQEYSCSWLRYDFSVALLAHEKFDTSKCKAQAAKLFKAVQLWKALPNKISPIEICKFLTAISAWGQGSTADDLVLALDVLELSGVNTDKLDADDLEKAIKAGRAVKSDPFQHLSGPAIGKATMNERAVQIALVI